MTDHSPQMFFVGRGRPPRAGVRATRRVEFLLTCEERIKLDQVANESGQKLAEVVREAVNEFVADYSERRVFISGKKSA